MPFTAGFSSLHNALNLGPGSWLNDSRVAVLHIVLWNFAFIDLLLFSKKIRGKLLLCCDRTNDTTLFFIA